MTSKTRLQKQRQKAVEILLSKADKTVPALIDYHIDEWARNALDLPPRPDGQAPYEGWMIGRKESSLKDKKISETGVALIKKWEGCRLKAYQCSAQVWTVGWGHTKDVGRNTVISQEYADELLIQDLRIYEEAVNKYVKVPLTQNQFDAIVSLSFNIGIGAFQKSTLLRVLNRKDYAEAANQFLVWKYAKGKIVQGLINRRADERKLFLS